MSDKCNQNATGCVEIGNQEYAEAKSCYVIRFKGHLGEHWLSLFEDLTMTHEADGTTTLVGQMADQAALFGLLDKVRDLCLPLISVNQVEFEPKKESKDE